MSALDAALLARLRKEILPLEGLSPRSNTLPVDVGLGRIRFAFPTNQFPTAAVHEFLTTGPETVSASAGFVGGLVSALAQDKGITVWISSSGLVYPPALKAVGLLPHQVIFIQPRKEKELLWAAEEALKCKGLSAVVCETTSLDFTTSRRLQLAVESSGVTGFMLRSHSKIMHSTACVTRWRIVPLASTNEEGMPGVGFPRWQVELLKVRNGQPGVWQVEWREGRFVQPGKTAAIVRHLQTQTG